MRNGLLVVAVLVGLLMPLMAYGQVTDPSSPADSIGANVNAQGPADESSSERLNIIHLGLKQSRQAGSIELVERTAVGDVALLRENRFDSQLSWRIPGTVAAGWYRARFPATARFQMTAEMQREREPFIFTVRSSDNEDSDLRRAFAFKSPSAESVSLEGLSKPFLNPTPVQTWYSSQPLWIDGETELELAVRRPMLVVGDLELEPVGEHAKIWTTLEGQSPYNMYTDDQPVRFRYSLRNLSDQSFEGRMRFTLTDALDGSEQQRGLDVSLEPGGEAADELDWEPAFGAYQLTADTLSDSGELLYRQHRHLTYSPTIDPHELPDSWPVAFHRHPNHPEMIPPIGAKWVRVWWGGWSHGEPEPGVYDWSVMDSHVRMAQKHGYRLLWITGGGPEWALPAEVRGEPRASAKYPPEDMERMRPFLRAFWERYLDTGVIGAVEVSNEPNTKPAWTPEKYAELARVIYEETRRATPDVPVVAISMSGGLHLDYMRRALGAGLDKHMDIASLHLYEIGNPVGDRSIERKTRLFKEVLQEHDLGHLPIWNTESGSNTSIRQDGVIVDQEELNRQIHQHPDFDPSTPFRIGNNWRASSELLGTAKVIGASYQQFAMGVEKNFMYQWGGSPHHYWVYDYDGDGNPMPKIKVVAAAMMSKMLRDYGSDPTPEQPNVESLKEGWLPFGHRFAGPGGRMIIVYVHPSETDAGPGDQLAALATGDVDATLEQASQHSEYLRTEKPEPVAVRVPVSADRAIVMDMFGRDRETVEATGGSVEIDVTEVPQYVLEME